LQRSASSSLDSDGKTLVEVAGTKARLVVFNDENQRNLLYDYIVEVILLLSVHGGRCKLFRCKNTGNRFPLFNHCTNHVCINA
jgi:hypothetical protein